MIFNVFWKYLVFIVCLSAASPLLSQSEESPEISEEAAHSVFSKEAQEDEEDEYRLYQGKIIRNIAVKIFDVSGGSIKSESESDTSWLGKIGNSLHYKTRDWVVSNALLFNAGDSLDPAYIAESERILRRSGLFVDARIRVNKLSETSDSVDVRVFVQDRWTLSVLASYSAQNKNGYAGFRDNNFLGMGHEIDATITRDNDPSVGWGTKTSYTAQNIAGTFIDGTLLYRSNRKSDFTGLSLNRSFLSTVTDWAGGIDLNWEHGRFEFFDNQSSLVSIPFSRSKQDIWAGYSLPVWFGQSVFRNKSRFNTGVRIINRTHSSRPPVSPILNRIFENNTLFLINAGVINERYYRDTYVDRFGVTEDIPIGGSLVFTGGYEHGEFNNRWYTGGEFIYSRRIDRIGYISSRAALGGFRNGGRWEQNVFNFNIIFHSKLFNGGEWTHRYYVNTDLMMGFNRFSGEQIYLDTETGMRGYDRYYLYGTKRLLTKLEYRIFSPYAPLGFSLGGIAFADFGLINGRNAGLFDSKFYQSYGIGIRTQNESIARTEFQIALAYVPFNGVSNSGSVKILIGGKVSMGKRELRFSPPSLFLYNGMH